LILSTFVIWLLATYSLTFHKFVLVTYSNP
jgi:hypothetical protein